MSKIFNAKTLPLLAFTALAITSFARSASADCSGLLLDDRACLSGKEDSGNQPKGTFINQTINTITSEANTMGYNAPSNTNNQANPSSGNNSGGASKDGGASNSSNSIAQQIRNNGGMTDDESVYSNTKDNSFDTLKSLPGREDDYQSGKTTLAERNYPDGTFDIKEGVGLWVGNGPLSYGPNGIHAPNGSYRYGTAPVEGSAGNSGDEKKATSRSSTSAPAATTTATAAMLKKLGIGGRDPSRTTITTNSSGKVTAIVTDHRTQTAPAAPKMVSMVATTQHSGPITPPVASAPKLPQVPIALPSATTIKAK
jgi:hypothetical protein